MKIKKDNIGPSILEMDFSSVEESMEVWKKERERKIRLFNKYTNMIGYLEEALLVSEGIEILRLELQIKKLKKMREKHRVSGIFEVKLEIKEKKQEKVKRKY